MRISRKEFDEYREKVDGDETQATLIQGTPHEKAELDGMVSAIYSRLSGQLAVMKDEIDREFLRLIGSKAEGGEEMTMKGAEKAAEILVNGRFEVTRRDVEYLMKAVDKISFACASGIRAANKEGHY